MVRGVAGVTCLDPFVSHLDCLPPMVGLLVLAGRPLRVSSCPAVQPFLISESTPALPGSVKPPCCHMVPSSDREELMVCIEVIHRHVAQSNCDSCGLAQLIAAKRAAIAAYAVSCSTPS